jgi:hypothetical protein
MHCLVTRALWAAAGHQLCPSEGLQPTSTRRLRPPPIQITLPRLLFFTAVVRSRKEKLLKTFHGNAKGLLAELATGAFRQRPVVDTGRKEL